MKVRKHGPVEELEFQIAPMIDVMNACFAAHIKSVSFRLEISE